MSGRGRNGRTTASRGRLKTGWGPSRNFRGSIWGCRGPKPGLGTEGGVRNVLAPRLDVEKNEARTSLGALPVKTHVVCDAGQPQSTGTAVAAGVKAAPVKSHVTLSQVSLTLQVSSPVSVTE